MIYNFNHGIGWASSGVEYAQIYRARMLRNINQEAKFVFTDMFPSDNIEHLSKNIGFLDSEIIWLYSFFTDFKISPVTYTLRMLEKSFENRKYSISRDGKVVKYVFEGNGDFYTCYMVDDHSDLVHRVEIVSGGCLIRKDYFTYGKLYSEYYAPLENKAHMYSRRFFNEDGTVAYEEINDDNSVIFKFSDRVLYSKEELIGYMVSELKLTDRDIVIIDRTTDIGQAIIENANDAKIGVVIHADHFSEGSTDDENILWNNYYEYAFAMNKHLDFYISSTDAQSELVREQFKKYMGAVEPNVITIPVGSIAELKYPDATKGRKPFSLLTASRLASEKHIDWIVDAVAEAKKEIPELTLDIYGKGGEEEKIKQKISDHNAEEYIHLMGQCDMSEVYQNYEAYIAGSTSEGFGLTLLEAVGGGLPIIGFDVRYGNPTFIDDEKNGYLIDYDGKLENNNHPKELAEKIVKLFKEADLDSFHRHSYEKASGYLTKEIENKWQQEINRMM